MTVFFQLILLISFLGLVIIITKNKFANPQMRVRFLEDWEKNRSKLTHWTTSLSELIKSFSASISAYVKPALPRIKKGILFIYQVGGQGVKKARTAIASQAKELKADIQSFEIPDHKQDFLDRLDGGDKTHQEQEPKETVPEKSEVQPSPAEQKTRYSLPKYFSFSKQSQLEKNPESPVKEESTPKEVAKENVRGFHVVRIAQREQEQESEVDAGILQKKERWLLYAIAKNPKNANFYKKLGRIYLQMNSVDDARNCFEYALKLGSQDPEIKSLLSSMR